jgi:flagellar biosynthesis protein FlhG
MTTLSATNGKGTATLRSATAFRPRRLTIASGKGGVGKTWFAVTLAQALAMNGEGVLLVDADLGLANVDVQLGLTPHADLAAVVAREITLEEAVAPYAGGRGVAKRGGFDVLPGRSGAGTLSGLAQAELASLASGLAALEAAYDRIVVDLGAGLDHVVTTFAAHAGNGTHGHAVFVVLTDEPTSLTDAYAFIKVMRLRAAACDLRVVVNRASSYSQGKRTYQALETACRNFLSFSPPLAGVVPEDARVAESIRHQSALLTRYPQSKAGAGIMAIAQALHTARAPA